uniref:Thioredoxin n=1 Tax=Hucho hucho TaxID=62062 RepID=A0A4W5K1J0_9TELE
MLWPRRAGLMSGVYKPSPSASFSHFTQEPACFYRSVLLLCVLSTTTVKNMIIVIEDKDSFLNALKEAGDKLVVVDFTATWCGPCKNIAPFFKELSENPENSNVVFLKVDVDEAADVSQYCEIKCMPTFHFYKNGKKVDDFSGANQATLEEKVKALKS